MIKKIKTIVLSLALVFGLAVVPALVVAPNVSAQSNTGDCLSQAAGLDGDLSNIDQNCKPSNDTTNVTNDVSGIMKTVVNIFSLVVGFISIVMIIWGGLKYITSGGDSGKVSGAKNTIIYALIGLVIVALAQLIVRFVLSKTGELSNG